MLSTLPGGRLQGRHLGCGRNLWCLARYCSQHCSQYIVNIYSWDCVTAAAKPQKSDHVLSMVSLHLQGHKIEKNTENGRNRICSCVLCVSTYLVRSIRGWSMCGRGASTPRTGSPRSATSSPPSASCPRRGPRRRPAAARSSPWWPGPWPTRGEDCGHVLHWPITAHLSPPPHNSFPMVQ